MNGFIDVVLRGLMLVGQSLAIGGAAFLIFVARPLPFSSPARIAVRRVLVATAAGAAVVALGQLIAALAQLAALADGGAWPWAPAIAILYFRVSLVRLAASAAVIAATIALARALEPSRRATGHTLAWKGTLVAAAVVLGIAAGLTSHAAARLGDRALLVALDTLHQLAAGAWVGGLLHLLLCAPRLGDPAERAALLRRFSTLALGSVATLAVVGVALAVRYIGDGAAIAGTAYGLMVSTKVVLLGVLLGLGALNFFAVRRLAATPPAALTINRVVEVEFGLGVTVLFAAASLTSLPPAIDVPAAERATTAEVLTRFTPRWPRLTSPALGELPVADPSAPRTPEDEAWSEYNHHVAGLFVVVMGVLAIVSRAAWASWARHWPLLFLGLAAFLAIRDDPGAWPLGPLGFWESMRSPAVLQHRLFVLLVIAFATFEWAVRTGHLAPPSYALVFPALCAVGGALLLTHSHAALNLKSEFLIEVTHAPLGVLGIATAWGRWLELRLPAGAGRMPGRIGAVAFVLVGVLLLLYRES